MKTLYLVDASAMFFRAYYAVRPLSNSKGLPTNALYGFLQMTIKLLKDAKPDYMVYCFDRKEPSFRKELYSDYKANRSEMPEDLVPQMPYFRRITSTLGIGDIDKEKFEADDVIGTLAKLGEKEKLKVVIVSGDKDFAQLISKNTVMYDTMKDIKYDIEAALEKWGVDPGQMIDYLALVGDSSDNIPGVRGIGPKGAQKLLGEFGSLNELYKKINEVKNDKLRQKLIDAEEMAFLSQDLVTIRTDVPLDVEISDLKLKEVNRSEVHELFEELEFKSFEKRLFGESVGGDAEKSGSSAPTKSKSKSKAKKINEEVGTSEVLKKVLKKGETVWGFQTDRGLFLGTENTVYNLETNDKKLVPLLESLKLDWKGYRVKSFWRSLEIKKTQSTSWSSALAAYIVRSGAVKDFPETYQHYVGETLSELPSAGETYLAHQALEEVLREKLKSTNGDTVYFDIELPLLPVLFEMETSGITVDVDALKKQSVDLEADIKNLEESIYEESGETFNIASPKQLGAVLFEKMGLPSAKKTKTGFSTDSSVLEKLAQEHPIAELIIEFRELSKLKSTYVDALPDLVEADGRVHTHFNQSVAATGRLSSTNPNLQNIPIRTERGRLIRKTFIPKKGCELISADYSQIELRLLAHLTNDKGLTRAFNEGHDVHAATASEVFGVKIADVTSEQRRMAKAVNFGLAYGQSVFGLSETLGIDRKEAKDIIDSYFKKFSGVKDYMFETVEDAKKNGYVETIFGRRRYLPELSSRNGMQRKFGERAAINAPLQGSASDIVKKAMIDLKGKVKGTMLLQVHDELVFETPKAHVNSDIKVIKEKMENVVKINVPLVVDAGVGSNWDEAH